MTKFNIEGKDRLTYGECLGPAMNIIDQEDADQYLKDYVDFIQKYLDSNPRDDDITALEIAKGNLGYYAGYYDHGIREQVERLFRCSHPIFGKVAETGTPSAHTAFSLGKKLGERMGKEGGFNFMEGKNEETI